MKKLIDAPKALVQTKAVKAAKKERRVYGPQRVSKNLQTFRRIGAGEAAKGVPAMPTVPVEQEAQVDNNIHTTMQMVRITGVHSERWQGSLLRWRHGRIPPGMKITVRGYTGTVALPGGSAASFVYQPAEKILRLDMVNDPRLEHAVRQWLGEIPL